LCEAHVEAIQLTEPLEAPLRRSDVDERRLPAQAVSAEVTGREAAVAVYTLASPPAERSLAA